MASSAERSARAATDATVRQTYLGLAQKWREMAEQVEVQERLLRQKKQRVSEDKSQGGNGDDAYREQ
jgi:hypothetical protein